VTTKDQDRLVLAVHARGEPSQAEDCPKEGMDGKLFDGITVLSNLSKSTSSKYAKNQPCCRADFLLYLDPQVFSG